MGMREKRLRLVVDPFWGCGTTPYRTLCEHLRTAPDLPRGQPLGRNFELSGRKLLYLERRPRHESVLGPWGRQHCSHRWRDDMRPIFSPPEGLLHGDLRLVHEQRTALCAADWWFHSSEPGLEILLYHTILRPVRALRHQSVLPARDNLLTSDRNHIC